MRTTATIKAKCHTIPTCPFRTIQPKSPPIGWRNSKRPRDGRCRSDFGTRSSRPTNRFSTTNPSVRSTRRPITVSGVRRISPIGWVMGAFEYHQAEEIRDAFAAHRVEHLFLGKSGAIRCNSLLNWFPPQFRMSLPNILEDSAAFSWVIAFKLFLNQWPLLLQ